MEEGEDINDQIMVEGEDMNDQIMEEGEDINDQIKEEAQEGEDIYETIEQTVDNMRFLFSSGFQYVQKSGAPLKALRCGSRHHQSLASIF